MAIDPELLARAKTAAAGLADAERTTVVARGEFHAAVRRLHLAGGSLREVAQALGVSHQRVQQIVRDAGGSWWSRVWRGRRMPPGAVCTWCGRPPSAVARLIAGPRVFICGDCVDAADRVVGRGRGSAGAFTRLGSAGRRGRCAFCGRRPGDGRILAHSPAGDVCVDCVATCRGILAHAAD